MAEIVTSASISTVPLRGKDPVVTNDSPCRTTICSATTTLVVQPLVAPVGDSNLHRHSLMLFVGLDVLPSGSETQNNTC